ncbi:nuclear poly(A) polymerase 3-like [Phragmites australis]|uniref:nuclear poly(A) polymerase 3-like n=1 Tax=Phragmites australis TaxID=29695 RepID=UPI002D769EE6|nr:nuclear poly(A) polymerase 3-like [Phragmites australis]
MSYLATATPVPWWPYAAMAPADLLAGTPASGAPEAQTLPVLLPQPPPPPAGYPPLPPRPPIIFRPHPAFLAELDHRRSRSLVKLLKDEGAVPSPKDDKKREQVIRELKKIVMHWAKVLAYEQSVPPRLATATVLTYGSYTLGAHGSESDIDALCVGPCIATLQYHFFVVLRQILEGRPEVSEVQTVESAKVPLMRFRFDGIAVDLTYAHLPAIDASKAINTFSPQLLQKIDARSWRSLSGVRVNEQIVQIVPKAENFQVLLRCVKLWARKRGLHCHHLGFFAGIHLAILAAYVCQRYPDASGNGLFTVFFQTFAHWPWQVPVSLHDQPTNCLRSEGQLMPIVMPCTPPEFCVSNVTKSTFNKIRQELMRGYALTKDPLRHDFELAWLFEPFPYAAMYQHFLRIALCAPTSAELRDWAGWVKSRFRHLILKLEKIGFECDPCPSEEVDHTVIELNIVYYWGLIPQTRMHIDTSSLKEDFMKDVTNDVYGKVKCTRSDLTISVVGLPQLPKTMCSSHYSAYRQYMPDAALYAGLPGCTSRPEWSWLGPG